ncbi:hypothetical protein TSO221_21505 [Azospirillum sp. TSO22-1]|nr:hypothetical protein TSO221_21505 [Azospirillum sp. TSO22-1]
MTVDTKLAAQALASSDPTPSRPAAKPASLEVPDFGDVLDALNPLHHVPVVSTLYEAATGSRISTAARLAGGYLYGGPAGLLGSAAISLVEGVTGDSVGGHLRTLAEQLGEPDAAGPPPALPWMKPATAPDARPATGAASSDAVAEALRQAARTSDAAFPATGPAAARLPPELLAKLYAAQATQPDGARSIRI